MSRFFILMVSMLLLILCIALPAISHADSGDEVPNTPTPEPSAELTPAAILLAPVTISREAAGASAAQAEAAALPYRVALPLILGGSGGGNATTSAFEDQVVQLINQERIQAGCPALQIVPELSQAARQHSEDMAANDFFSHTGSDGSRPWDRMEQAGYNWSAAAENIAAAVSTPADVVAIWMNSPLHRTNILNCNLRDTGLGFVQLIDDTGTINYHTYWTEVFGNR